MPPYLEEYAQKPIPHEGARPRLTLKRQPEHVFAIGDVHGCLDVQQKMEQSILEEFSDQSGIKLIIHLGDLVDSGYDSKGVIDHCLSPLPDGFERLCLCGNHDQMFLDFLKAPSLQAKWLEEGGRETLLSYGINSDQLIAQQMPDAQLAAIIADKIPTQHVAFLEKLPVALSTPEAHFVHAGMRIGIAMADQDEHDLMWIREAFLVKEQASDRLIVHGHTPAPMPRMGPGRIGIDTKAVGGGPLTALHLHNGKQRFLTVVTDRCALT